jgi:Spy/CpxP family protein refolding chaperone
VDELAAAGDRQMVFGNIDVRFRGSSIVCWEETVRKTLVCLVAVCVVSLSGLAGAVHPQTPQAGTPTRSVDEILKSLRADMQGTRADIMAKNLTLTAEQAGKFWPLFDKYQKEQNVIMDAQLKGIQKYADTYQTLDDAGALALITAHLDRDAKMTALRQQWLGEFQKVVPARIAARAMQIDRRLSNLAQLEISAQIPLIH